MTIPDSDVPFVTGASMRWIATFQRKYNNYAALIIQCSGDPTVCAMIEASFVKAGARTQTVPAMFISDLPRGAQVLLKGDRILHIDLLFPDDDFVRLLPEEWDAAAPAGTNNVGSIPALWLQRAEQQGVVLILTVPDSRSAALLTHGGPLGVRADVEFLDTADLDDPAAVHRLTTEGDQHDQ